MTDALTDRPPTGSQPSGGDARHASARHDDSVTAPPAGAVRAPGAGGPSDPFDGLGDAGSGGSGGTGRTGEDGGRGGVRDRLSSLSSEQVVFGVITCGVVTACIAFVFLQLDPWKLFSNTTPAGGDMGAHVWAPAYLRDHLLPKGRLTGWTPDWYAGFPAFQFYMILPSLAIALLSYVLPYGVAFKLVAVSGCLSLPFCAYFFGRMTRLPFPTPALLSVAATLFLFDRSFSIYGGNIPSTLAGEFAFSISLSLGLLYLGVLGRGLETGRHRGAAALLLALTGLCHLIPFIFVLICTGLWLVVRPGIGQLKYILTTGPVAGALAAFWLLPFYGRSGYMNDMGWEKITNFRDYLWDRDKLDPQLVNSPNLQLVIAFAAVGLLLSLAYRRRAGLFLALTAVTFAVLFVFMPDGRLWNARLLPFYYLSCYLLAAVGIGELGRLLSALFASDVNRPLRTVAGFTPVLACAIALVMLGLTLQAQMPGAKKQPDGSYGWSFLSTTDRSFVDSWADWNFSGYEGFDRTVTRDASGAPVVDANGETALGPPTYKKSYPEYHDIINTMKQLGQNRGCGRAMWEHEEQHDRYGTPMALMLLPFWTDGCIGSMEGLYFEASTTTPYHFINQDELSWAPSNAQRDLPYGTGPPTKVDFDLGIRHLQMMGVTYYMAINDQTKDLANQNTSLESIATSGPWTVYAVADAPLVEGLKNEPAVLVGQDTTHRPWQDTSVCWYQNPDDWGVSLAADGPSSWQRVQRTVVPDAKTPPAQKCESDTAWGWFTNGAAPAERPEKPVTVTNVATTDDSISFDVDQTGIPVLVKASYFPNWAVDGADGPYRVAPNFMVVVPGANHVELHYGYTRLDVFAWWLTLVGLVGLVYLFRARPVKVRPPRSFWGRAERPDLYPTDPPDLRFEPDPYEWMATAPGSGLGPAPPGPGPAFGSLAGSAAPSGAPPPPPPPPGPVPGRPGPVVPTGDDGPPSGAFGSPS